MFGKSGAAPAPDKVSTVIGRGSVFKGTIEAKGLFRIDGEFEGTITNTGDVIVAEGGLARVDLKARNVTIAGRFEGALEAGGKLSLKRTAKAQGTFKINDLQVEEGAQICGGLEMDLEGKKENKGTLPFLKETKGKN